MGANNKGRQGVKTILCYGDSNTWGYDPASKGRLGIDARWTGVLARELGTAYRVLEEGLNGRTTVWDDPIEGYKNGREQLVPCLESQRPFDLLTLMLGTNDLKMRFSVSAFDIAKSVGKLIEIAQQSNAGPDGQAPQVLLLAPPPVAKLTEFAEMFAGAEEKLRRLGPHYRRVAEEMGCHFLDTSSVIVSSDLDGIHFEAAEHAKLGAVVAAKIREILA